MRPIMVVSFKMRLLMAASLVVMVVIGLALALLLVEARSRVTAERGSSVELARHLVTDAIKALDGKTADPLSNLVQDLREGPQLRHVHLFVLPIEQEKAEAFKQGGGRPTSTLLRALLRPDPWEMAEPVVVNGRNLGQVLIIASPEDELDEIGNEFTFISLLLLSLTAIVLAVVWWSVTRAMQPLRLLQAGLGRLQKGDFAAVLPPFSVPELQPIGDTFNHLAQALGQAQDENRLLIHKLLSVQETERAELAQDFHDELGPCLFGIKMEAACIARGADALPAGEAKERAAAIAKLVEDLQQLNRRILGKLRPLALAELGLRAALDRLVEEWRVRAPAIEWIFICLRYEFDPPEDQALALYRVAQEAMTNAARHSQAQSVRVVLECGRLEGGQAGTRLQIIDDGIGLPRDARRGFGLLGIRERVQALGGRAEIGAGLLDAGVTVSALLGDRG